MYPGSPLQFYVDAINARHVSAYGPGLSHGMVNKPATFTIVTKDAGEGKLNPELRAECFLCTCEVPGSRKKAKTHLKSPWIAVNMRAQIPLEMKLMDVTYRCVLGINGVTAHLLWALDSRARKVSSLPEPVESCYHSEEVILSLMGQESKVLHAQDLS